MFTNGSKYSESIKTEHHENAEMNGCRKSEDASQRKQ